MTTCQECAAAATKLHHGFASGCQGCAARAASRSQHYLRVRQAGRLDRQYQAMLEQFGLTHDEVKAAHAADSAA